MSEKTDALRAEIDQLNEQVAAAKNKIAMTEADANQQYREQQLEAERNRLRQELESLTTTGIVSAPPETVAVTTVPESPATVDDLSPGERVVTDTPVDDGNPSDPAVTRRNR